MEIKIRTISGDVHYKKALNIKNLLKDAKLRGHIVTDNGTYVTYSSIESFAEVSDQFDAGQYTVSNSGTTSDPRYKNFAYVASSERTSVQEGKSYNGGIGVTNGESIAMGNVGK